MKQHLCDVAGQGLNLGAADLMANKSWWDAGKPARTGRKYGENLILHSTGWTSCTSGMASSASEIWAVLNTDYKVAKKNHFQFRQILCCAILQDCDPNVPDLKSLPDQSYFSLRGDFRGDCAKSSFALGSAAPVHPWAGRWLFPGVEGTEVKVHMNSPC